MDKAKEHQMIEKVISGGQTGADTGGLLAAHQMNIATGGYVPKGFKTEQGGMGQEWLQSMGLVPTVSSDYGARTRLNVKESDGTALFGNMDSPGSRLTLGYTLTSQKPHIVNPTSEELARWIISKQIRILNVAGNRESHNPGIQLSTLNTVFSALQQLKDGTWCS
jgi:hypothetical protein